MKLIKQLDSYYCVFKLLGYIYGSKTKEVYLVFNYEPDDKFEFDMGTVDGYTKDVPESIKQKFKDYIESEFFEIDLKRYMESEKGVDRYNWFFGNTNWRSV